MKGMTRTSEFDHFVKAQESVYGQVVRELAEGHKQTH